jgi:hypothetical protein
VGGFHSPNPARSKSPAVPPAERITGLRRDYLAMRDIVLVEPIDFKRILATPGDLEGRR